MLQKTIQFEALYSVIKSLFYHGESPNNPDMRQIDA